MSMTHDEMIAVIQAHKDRKPLEVRITNYAEWLPCPLPVFDFRSCDYRIKPEPPKPREWVLRVCPGIAKAHGKDSMIGGFAFDPGKEPMHDACPQCQTIHVREVLPDEEGRE